MFPSTRWDAEAIINEGDAENPKKGACLTQPSRSRECSNRIATARKNQQFSLKGARNKGTNKQTFDGKKEYLKFWPSEH
ncbi:hypothetical protein TNIN_216501 [Trichonephila inaurata madagascariensis]|uniref:Uncharacterized protein n=1 Tax=Trichonephila inaurata madagascariensis TaxID=2747483 RepID=A0A8X6YXB6_9ARAC|nr:hypothetical protein TNIN_216501 [Trichonephila inaurata madagascariensis]